MISKAAAARGVGGGTEFRWRGGEVSRIEGFSDAVFAFAVTLLVVSLEVPKSFTELMSVMRGFVAFAICFAILFSIWYRHYMFFRRYGLEDPYTKILTGVLLFVVLFYTYPLKFLFTLLVNEFIPPILGAGSVEAAAVPGIEPGQVALLMVIYGLGFIAVPAVFVLLYSHAYRKREVLEMNVLEVFDTRVQIEGYLLEMGVGVLSVALAGIGGVAYASLAGWTYFLLGPLGASHGTIGRMRRRKLENRFAAVKTAPGA